AHHCRPAGPDAGELPPPPAARRRRRLAREELLRRPLDRIPAHARPRAAGTAAVHGRRRLRGRPVDLLQAAARGTAQPVWRRRAGAHHLAPARRACAGAPVRRQAGGHGVRCLLAAGHRRHRLPSQPHQDHHPDGGAGRAGPAPGLLPQRRLLRAVRRGLPPAVPHGRGARSRVHAVLRRGGEDRPAGPPVSLGALRPVVRPAAPALRVAAAQQPVLAFRGPAGTGTALDAAQGTCALPPVGFRLGAPGRRGVRAAGRQPALAGDAGLSRSGGGRRALRGDQPGQQDADPQGRPCGQCRPPAGRRRIAARHGGRLGARHGRARPAARGQL
ncbi:MAG: FIG00999102: hypothetical protein, partial [uncultured Ramlibacter sp.]